MDATEVTFEEIERAIETDCVGNMLVCEHGMNMRVQPHDVRRNRKFGCFSCFFGGIQQNNSSGWTAVTLKLCQKTLSVQPQARNKYDDEPAASQDCITIDIHRHFCVVRSERVCADPHGSISGGATDALHVLKVQEKHFSSEEEDLEDHADSNGVRMSDVITLSSRHACVVDIWEKGFRNVFDSFVCE